MKMLFGSYTPETLARIGSHGTLHELIDWFIFFLARHDFIVIEFVD